MDWPTLAYPDAWERFDLPMLFAAAEAERIRRGFIPRGSDDRWFLFVENDVLYCHRSWTGALIYSARLVSKGSETRLADCRASRDPRHHASRHADVDRKELARLIRSHLLDDDYGEDDMAG